jgi:hypothetical protein
MRAEIAVGNVSCGMGAGVASIDATVEVAELKKRLECFFQECQAQPRNHE